MRGTCPDTTPPILNPREVFLSPTGARKNTHAATLTATASPANGAHGKGPPIRHLAVGTTLGLRNVGGGQAGWRAAVTRSKIRAITRYSRPACLRVRSIRRRIQCAARTGSSGALRRADTQRLDARVQWGFATRRLTGWRSSAMWCRLRPRERCRIARPSGTWRSARIRRMTNSLGAQASMKWRVPTVKN